MKSNSNKGRVNYVCSECGADSLRWVGRCPACSSWDTMVEEVVVKSPKRRISGSGARPVPLAELGSAADCRLRSRLGEFDRVLGGGVVAGTTVLVAGEPGIGKSTLMLQAAAGVAHESKTLYVTGEESLAAVSMRAERLGARSDNLFLLRETDADAIAGQIIDLCPAFAVVDSIQVVECSDVPASAGSVAQVRESAMRISEAAKASGSSLFLVGHITKGGQIAGPKILEHFVDAVLFFEGDRYHAFRVLRARKNRFGAAGGIGVFEMTSRGLVEVENPSELFLESRTGQAHRTGSVVVSTVEGGRPFLVEIQALTTKAVYGTPNRKTSGVDHTRVNMVLAVLAKRAGYQLFDLDVFINAAGGIRIEEPAADLAIALSVVSSIRDISFPVDTAVAGELGLGGEIRKVAHADKRVEEARRIGFKRFLLPRGNSKSIPSGKIEILGVDTLDEAIEGCFQ